jgi:hypothetical protein
MLKFHFQGKITPHLYPYHPWKLRSMMTQYEHHISSQSITFFKPTLNKEIQQHINRGNYYSANYQYYADTYFLHTIDQFLSKQ